MYGTSDRDTHLYPPHNNSSVPLTIITYVQRSGRITMECELGSQPHKTPDFHPQWHRHPLPWNDPPRKAWVRLNRHRISVGHFRSCLFKLGMASSATCECGLEEQPSTLLSFNVQSIDLPMDCMACRFWTMRQSNGCSTPALISSAAKQWFEQLDQKKKNVSYTLIACKRSTLA